MSARSLRQMYRAGILQSRETTQTRLNAFAPKNSHSLFNATAVAAQCHSQQTNSQSLARRHHQVRNV